jgi:hypothetical protein
MFLISRAPDAPVKQVDFPLCHGWRGGEADGAQHGCAGRGMAVANIKTQVKGTFFFKQT